MKIVSNLRLMFKDDFVRVKNSCLEYNDLEKKFGVLFAIYMLAISAIIRADVAYIDDMGRKAFGYTGWDNFSRYLSNGFSQIISANRYLTDISPLTQFIAVLFISIASLIIIMVFAKDKKITYWNIAAVLPLGLSPYFLECLSYKFDSPFMALSVLGCVFPILFRECSIVIYLFMVVFGVLITCTTYQASLGIFPMLVIFIALIKWHNEKTLKSIVLFIVYSAIGYTIALMIYKFIIMKPVNTYVGTAVFPLYEMLPGIKDNLKKYFTLIYSDFERKYFIFICVILVSFIIQFTVNYRKNKIQAAALAVLALGTSLVLAFGPYVALVKPLFACRAMYGVGVWVAIVAVITTNLKFLNYVPKMAVIGLSWCLFTFSFTYGNALAEQQRYAQFRMEVVLHDLNNIASFKPNKNTKMQFIGGNKISPVIKNIPQYKKGNVLRRLIQPVFSGGTWYWSTFYFYNYYGLHKIKNVDNLKELNLPVLKDNYYERIRGENNNWLIELK